MSPTDKMIDKIRKLKAKADSAAEIGSQAEAETFASKMRELMERHELSMSEIEFSHELNDEPIGESWINWEDHGFRNTKRRTAWIERLARIVTKAHGCKFMVLTRSNRIIIVGHESNRQLAEYTLATLVRTADKLSLKEYDRVWLAYKAEHGHTLGMKGYRNSWLMGFCERINERLEERKKSTTGDASTALIRIDTKLAKVEQHMAEDKSIKSAAVIRGSRKFNASGRQDGRRFADGMDLNGRAVNGRTSDPHGQLR